MKKISDRTVLLVLGVIAIGLVGIKVFSGSSTELDSSLSPSLSPSTMPNQPTSPQPAAREDILLRERDYREERSFEIDPTNLPVIGQSTEEDIYDIFGEDVDRRLTYNQLRTKTVGKSTFSYNRIINYADVKYNHYREEKNGLIATGGIPYEYITVVIYLKDGVVTYYSISDKLKKGTELIPIPEKTFNVDANGEAWPDGTKDITDYLRQSPATD